MQNSDERFGSYCMVEQRRLWQVCAYAQTCLSHLCLHTQSMEVEKDSQQKLDV